MQFDETELSSAACAVTSRQPLECKVCGNELGNRIHQAREMMFGFGDCFEYVECADCGCLGLVQEPADISRFYPTNYYSYLAKEGGLRGLAKRLRVQAYFSRRYGLGSWIAARYPRPDLAAIARMAIPKSHRILDVGCGGGKLLLELNQLGYENLTGTDPFIEADLDYGNGVVVKKCVLSHLARSAKQAWDLIMFHHSFEHIPDQLGTLHAAAQLLAPEGICVIRTPVIGYAWQEYGINWVQLDPPRHCYLHTEKSLELLSQKAGLKVKSVEYDSNEFQFWGSDLYRRGITLRSDGVPGRFFSAKQFRDFKRKSAELNAARRGDQAMFVLGL